MDWLSAARGRGAAFGRVVSDARMRRALLAYFAFSCVEWGVWIVVLVYARGAGSAATVGFVAVAQLIPAALLAPSLASLVDRLPRGAAPLVAYGTVTVSLTVTATAMVSAAPFPVVIILAVVTNVAVGLARPAHHSLTPCLAKGPAELVAANVVTSTSEGVGLFVGPAIVGLAMSAWSTGAALFVCVGIMVAAAVSTVGLSTTRISVRGDGMEVDTGIAAGFRALRKAPSGRLPMLIAGMQAVLEGAVDVLIVLLAIDVLGLGDGGAGYLNSLMGIGAVVGGLLSSALVGRIRLAPPVAMSGLVTGAAMMLIGVLPAAGLFLALAGVGYTVTSVAARTMLQRLSPMAAMGRMFGFMESISLVGLAVGALAAPLMAGWVGVEVAFALFGGVMPLTLLLLWGKLRVADALSSVPFHAARVLQRVEVVGGLPPDALEAMARGAVTSRVPPGEVIVAEGSFGGEMFVIESGEVEVTRRGRAVAILGAGDIFGEIALLDDVPRIATVTATRPTSLVVINREAFLAALATDRDAHRAVEGLAAGRRAATLGDGA